MRQADLASSVGISASYLNLIEHDKRRIGGKLVVDIAGVLGVESTLLSEGAEAALISALREAANVVRTQIQSLSGSTNLPRAFLVGPISFGRSINWA